MKKLFENWRKHITEAEYEPGRAVADIDTGEERMSPEEIRDEEVQDLADKFGVEASIEIASDGWSHSYPRELAAYPIDYLKKHKFWPSVGRVDNTFGDRNLICSCLDVEAYMEDN